MPHRNPHLPTVITCSGASDVGELTDRVGRTFSRSNVAHLECMAAVGAHDAKLVDKLRQAKQVLAIDGCASRCVSKALDNECIEHYKHLELGDLGFLKGHSPATDENVHRASEAAKVLLGG
ncbi:MAG: putative zinc-binding protein [Fibrobacterota bacterium]